MPPSKVPGNDAKVDPATFVKWYMLMAVVKEWHTKISAVSCHVRRNEEKITKLEQITDPIPQQMMMLLKMFQEIANEFNRMKLQLAVLVDGAGADKRSTSSPIVSPMVGSPTSPTSPLEKKPKIGSSPMIEEELIKWLELFNGNGQVAANEAAADEAEAKAKAAHEAEVQKKAWVQAMELLKKETPGHKVSATCSIVNDLLELSPVEFVRSIKKMVENNEITTDQEENLMELYSVSPRRKLRF